MARNNPATIGITTEARLADPIGDLRKRMAATERGGGSSPGGTASVVDATTTVKGKVQLAGDIGGIASAVVVKKLTSLGTTAMTDQLLNDTAHGGDWTTGPVAQRYEIRHGSVGTPTDGTAPTFRLISWANYTGSTALSGTDAAALTVKTRGSATHKIQAQAASFVAQNLSTTTRSLGFEPDAQAVSGIGEIISGGTGRAIGGFFYGKIQASAGTGAQVTGIEGASWNYKTDHSILTSGTGAGSDSMGCWLLAAGGFRSAAALQMGAEAGSRWQCGIFVGDRTSPPGSISIIEESTFRDDGRAATSIDINGAHATAAIGISPTAGYVGIGTKVPGSPLTVLRNTAGAVGYFTNSTANATQVNVYASSATQQAVVNFGDSVSTPTTSWQVGRQGAGHLFMHDNVAGYSPVLIAHTTGTQTLRTGAITDRLLSDSAHGELAFAAGLAGQRYDIRHGSFASPVTTDGPSFRISETQNYASGVTNGADYDKYSAFQVTVRGLSTTKAQPIAANFIAWNSGDSVYDAATANTDALGLQTRGHVRDGGTGRGLGATLEGRTTSTVATSAATGNEIAVVNRTGTADAIVDNGIGSRTMGIWLHGGDSTGQLAAGIQFGMRGAQFDTGIYFTGTGSQGNPIANSSYRDDGNAHKSIFIRGTHDQAAIAVAAGAGNVGIGDILPAYPLTVARTDAGDTASFNNSGAVASRIGIIASASQRAMINFYDTATGRWQLGKETDNSWFLNEAVASFKPLSIAPTTGTQTLRTGAMADVLIKDQQHGDAQSWFGLGTTGQRWDIRHGTAAAPVTTEGPTVKISRHEEFTPVSNGADSPKYSALTVVTSGSANTRAQPTAIVAHAKSVSTQTESYPTFNPDACAVFGHGLVWQGGVGRALGAYFQAFVGGGADAAGTDATLTGIESQVTNNLVDHTYSASGKNSYGIFITNSGTKHVVAANAITHAGNTGRFRIGWLVRTTNPIIDSTFRDDGNATTSLDIRGTHTNALSIGATAGPILLTEQSVPATPANTALALYAYDNGGTTELRYLDSTGTPVTLGAAGAGGPPSGAAGGDLAGTYPNPTINNAATPRVTSLALGVAVGASGSLSITTNASGSTSTQGLFVSSVGAVSVHRTTSGVVLNAFSTVDASAQPRFRITMDASDRCALTWGSGAAAPDTYLLRSAAGTLDITRATASNQHLNFPGTGGSSIKFDTGSTANFISAANAGGGLKIVHSHGPAIADLTIEEYLG